MPELIVPIGQGALDAGPLVDDAGDRFIVLTFKDPQAEPVRVALAIDPFRQYVGYLNNVLEHSEIEASWSR